MGTSFRRRARYRNNRPNRFHRLGACKSERRKKRGELEREGVERRCQRVIVCVVEVSARRIVVQIVAQGIAQSSDRVEMRMDFGCVAVVGMDMLERSQAKCG